MKRLTIIASLSGICASFLDLPIIVILGEIYPRYDHFKDFASALGATGSPHAGIISAWWIVYGILLSIFSYGLLTSMKKEGALWPVGPLLVMIFAIADGIGSGVFPCDPGCAGITGTGRMHMTVSLIGTSALVFAPFFTWNAWRKDERWRVLRTFTLIVQTVGGMAVCALGYSTVGNRPGFFTNNGGLLQRLFLLVYYVWIFSVAARLISLPMTFEGKRKKE